AGMVISDSAAGAYAAVAVVAGLLGRDGGRAEGAATTFSVSLLGALTSLVWERHIDLWQRWSLPDRAGNGHHHLVVMGAYQAGDGGWIMIDASTSEGWRRLVGVVGGERLQDPRYE